MQLLERFDTVVSLMTEDEARRVESEIIRTGDHLRALLVDFYERQGYKALGYSSYTAWGEVVAPRIFGMTRRRLAQELTAAVLERELGTIVPNSIPESQLRPMSVFVERPRGPGADEKPFEINGEAIRAAWDEANQRSDGKPTARVVEDVVREMRGDQPARPAPVETPENDVLDPPMEPAQALDMQRQSRINTGLYSSATPEWYTPRHIIDRVLALFGQIDLDPCSNSADPALANVPAQSYWTQADNGLAQLWCGNVYMNPPYGDEIGAWVERLHGAYESGEIEAAIALLPARTDTAWFQNYMADYRWCLVRGRLKFSSSENSAPFPSVVVYLGADDTAFWQHFHDLGIVK